MRALFVSYAFPPAGGAGVQRVAKLARYLPSHGVEPTVLAADATSVPVTDASLLDDVPPDVRVVRARSLEPGYAVKRRALAAAHGAGEPGSGGGPVRRALRVATRLASSALFPDPQVLWLPPAGVALARLLRERPAPDVVVISAPPFSTYLLAPEVSRLSRAKLVLDYRDEWTTTLRSGHELGAGRFRTAIAGAMETRLARSADAIVTATEEFREALLARMPALDPLRVRCIPNGWDPADLPRRPGLPPMDRFVLAYAGTVFQLTSLRGVVQALELLHARSPAIARRIELHVFGRVVPSELDAFTDAERLGIRLHGYVEHRRALEALSRSHATLCVLDDVPGAERVYPAKVFELMALRRRCLVLAPPGALDRLARKHRVGEVVRPRDAEAIAARLARWADELSHGRYDARWSAVGVERFDRRALAGEWAAWLRRICGRVEEGRSPSAREAVAAS